MYGGIRQSIVEKVRWKNKDLVVEQWARKDNQAALTVHLKLGKRTVLMGKGVAGSNSSQYHKVQTTALGGTKITMGNLEGKMGKIGGGER